MKVAVLIDLAFAVKRYKSLIERPSGKSHSAEKVAKCLWDTSIKHVRPNKKDQHELYRILCYDCPPFEGNSQNPITKKNVNFAKTEQENNVQFGFRQKQVDMKLGIDIASLALKHLVDRIVLVAGDADFVPAAKLARREGIDFVLDPLWSGISQVLAEHIDAMKTHWPKPKTYTK